MAMAGIEGGRRGPMVGVARARLMKKASLRTVRAEAECGEGAEDGVGVFFAGAAKPRDREWSPGLLRDKRKYWPLYCRELALGAQVLLPGRSSAQPRHARQWRARASGEITRLARHASVGRL